MVFPTVPGHTNPGELAAGPCFFQSLIAWGIWPFGAYKDQIPPFIAGGWQLPCIFPPTTSAIDKPEKIGQVHWASGKAIVAKLGVIVPFCGVQVEAAQRA